jgi:cytochrome c1
MGRLFTLLLSLVVTLGLATVEAAPLSTLDPAGEDARAIAEVFWWMALSAAVIWLVAVGVLLYCLVQHRRMTKAQGRRIVVAGGVAPTVLLAVLVGGVLPRINGQVDAAPAPGAFVESGCGGCPTVRGTEASGTIGPDLTHLGRRQRLAASPLVNDADWLAHWLREPQAVEPGALMPPFAALGSDRMDALTAYLRELQ